MRPLLRVRPALSLLALSALAVTPLAVHAADPSTSSGVREVAASGACPAGQLREHESGDAEHERAVGASDSGASCVSPVHPESYRELSVANGQAASRDQAPYGVSPGAFAAGSAQATSLTSQGSVTSSRWQPVGTTPLIANGPDYGEVNQEGFVNLSGRVEDFSAVPGQNGHWLAAVANGGVQETSDAGANWRSIGDGLPTQITGTVAYDAGRVLVGTGDPAFGGDSLSGLGAFYSDNDGATWKQAAGVPTGTLSFQFAVDPSDASKVYLATSKGLYRSTDKGASYTNVQLPTTCTSTTDVNCFFANVVTDVVVQAKGGAKGTTGGGVLAAVGWRAGQKLNTAGKKQAPLNGLYTSTSGGPGSFHYLDPAGTAVPNVSGTGFPATHYLGRIALGIANGPTQDHGYVYALVEDAEKFNGKAAVLDANDGGTDMGLGTGGTVFNGVYGSADFGQHWTRLASAEALQSPATQTALLGANTGTYGPGIQSWYNEWITPDPSAALTDAATGAPKHLAFGLEEVWQNTLDSGQTLAPIVIAGTGSPLHQVQSTQFQVVGRYFGGNTCFGLNVTLPVPCATNVVNSGATTTHPDQHAGLFVPDATGGGTTLLVGNDGGVYAQHAAAGKVVTQAGWAAGTQGSDSGTLHTLLPYDAEMAKDGTIYGGLQDNGEMKITPDGKQYEIFGGDAFYTAVDPDNSNIAYEEYTNGAMSVTTDGGKTWTSIDPGLTASLFATPFKMDPRNAKHLVIGGREIDETTAGPQTNSSSNGVTSDAGNQWQTVFNLGTRTHPGDANATADTSDPNNGDPNNSLSAVDVDGANAYVGYCGACDIVTGTRPFASGIATNVGGSASPKTLTGQGWHIAKAIGLPQRYIESVSIDRNDPKTVYAALGGYGRRWIPPGALADDVSKVGTGHLFVSHDAGEHFTDVSGNLPDLPANWVMPFRGSLLVATDNGVFSTSASTPGRFRALAAGLPSAPVFHLSQSPRDPGEIVAASYGRGVYRIVVPTAATAHQDLPARHSGSTFVVKSGYTSGAPETSTAFGGSSDIGLSGDFDGDGVDELVAYRPSSSTFYIRSRSGAVTTQKFGSPGDQPVIGDFDGNGKDSVGVRRPSNATFYLTGAGSNGVVTRQLGNTGTGDIPLVGDFDGNRTDTVGVYRTGTASFLLTGAGAGTGVSTFVFGNKTGDRPVVGDWDGTGTDLVGVVRGTSWILSQDNRTASPAFGFTGSSTGQVFGVRR